MINIAAYSPQQTFLIQGDEQAVDTLVEELSTHDPLVQFLSVPRFTMDHARTVAKFATEASDTSRIFVVYFSVFSSEAAQVLLKSLEEPAANTTILFMTRYPYLVPQTVRSRLLIISGGIATSTQPIKTVIAQIQKEAAEKDDDAATRRGRALVLLDALESAVAKQPTLAHTVYRAKEMLFKGNLPTKYVLDYVATMVR